MGTVYTFIGALTITPPLTDAQRVYLEAFCARDILRRDAKKTAEMFDPLRQAASVDIGIDGAHFIGWPLDRKVYHDDNLYQYKSQIERDIPDGIPSKRCYWEVSRLGDSLHLPDSLSKFPEYAAWLQYLIAHFFTPWARTLSGSVGIRIDVEPWEASVLRAVPNENMHGTTVYVEQVAMPALTY